MTYKIIHQTINQTVSHINLYNWVTIGNDEILRKIARVAPYYRRNKPRICTFWVRGACNRGEECPYSHEEDAFDPSLSKQTILSRYKGKNDPLAKKIISQLEQKLEAKPEDQEKPMEYPSMNPAEAIKRLNWFYTM